MKKERAKETEEEEGIINWGGAFLFGIFLVIGVVFYVTLGMVKGGNELVSPSGEVTLGDQAEGYSFGWKEILFSIAFAFLMTGFLLWTKSTMTKNTYLGAAIGLIGLGIVGYGFSLRYRGPYSTGFMVAAALVTLVYLGMHFFRYFRMNKIDEDVEE